MLCEVRRDVTRAGMGLCQGRTCQRSIAAILCEELACQASEVAPASVRPPLRPVTLKTVVAEGRCLDAEDG
ncbi:MAG: hypothetical protein AB1445_04170 [Bacillota bacterium]